MSNEDRGLYDKYKVINNETKEEETTVFVLNPLKDKVAREAIRCYAKHTRNKVLSRDLDRWVKEFEDHACIDLNRPVCPKIGSPCCCCYCEIRNQCYDDGDDLMCDYVRLGDVNDIEECKEES